MGIMAAVLALAIAALGFYAALSLGHHILLQQNAKAAAQEAGTLIDNAKSLYANAPSGWLGITPQTLIDNGAVPPQMVNGGTIMSAFGTPIGVTVGFDAVANDSMLLVYQVPKPACSAFAFNVARYAAAVQIGPTDVQNLAAWATPTHGALDPSAIGSACAASGSLAAIKVFSGLAFASTPPPGFTP